MTTALITGVAGQDGIYLARHLRRLGHRVIGTVSSRARSAPAVAAYLRDVTVYEIDMRQSEALGVLIDRDRPDEIYNLASWSSVGRSWGAVEQVTAINGLAVLGLLEQVRRLRDRDGYDPRICQASSSEMFRLSRELPQTEDSPHHPRSPYAVSKSFAHHTAVNYRESYGMFVAVAILFNHESPLRPDSFVTRKITKAAAAISLGRQEELRLGLLDIRRDWGSAADYVVAIHAVLQHERPENFVIATGESRSLNDFIGRAFLTAGVPHYQQRVVSDRELFRPADVPETRGDASKARDVLGWKPAISFPDLVDRMVSADLARLRSGVENSLDYL